MKENLEKLLSNAYAPYSKYRVAAIVVTKDDKLFQGVNVENATYGATICAERNAINYAVSNGYAKDDFKSIHILNSSDKIGNPCFLCIETMSEFFGEEVEIVLYTIEGLVKTLKVSDIIKYDFTSENLS